jgi:hypothetical protein
MGEKYMKKICLLISMIHFVHITNCMQSSMLIASHLFRVGFDTSITTTGLDAVISQTGIDYAITQTGADVSIDTSITTT